MTQLRCHILPLPNQETAYFIDNVERLRWHGSVLSSPRPFFYPLIGSSGKSLTRMGHPGAPNHDHHRSVWFAHNKVQGIDFWSEQTSARIKQSVWIAYQDGEHECLSGFRLKWLDGHNPQPLLEQDVIAVVRPVDKPLKGDKLTNKAVLTDFVLEIQTTFRSLAATLELQKTNFGFLAVRVAKEISAYFGGGKISDSEERINEPAIFGKQARWMDYSGPNSVNDRGEPLWEGITFFDHPENPRHPTHWHVREDGWMGAAFCLQESYLLQAENPLQLRYMLHCHAGEYDHQRASELFQQFAKLTSWQLVKNPLKHTTWGIQRMTSND